MTLWLSGESNGLQNRNRKIIVGSSPTSVSKLPGSYSGLLHWICNPEEKSNREFESHLRLKNSLVSQSGKSAWSVVGSNPIKITKILACGLMVEHPQQMGEDW